VLAFTEVLTLTKTALTRFVPVLRDPHKVLRCWQQHHRPLLANISCFSLLVSDFVIFVTYQPIADRKLQSSSDLYKVA
jgi:hypothetical protein